MFDDVLARLRLRFNPVEYHRNRGVAIGQNVTLIGTRQDTFGPHPAWVRLADGVTIERGVHFITRSSGRLPNGEPGVFAEPIVIEEGARVQEGAWLMPGARVLAGETVPAGATIAKP